MESESSCRYGILQVRTNTKQSPKTTIVIVKEFWLFSALTPETPFFQSVNPNLLRQLDWRPHWDCYRSHTDHDYWKQDGSLTQTWSQLRRSGLTCKAVRISIYGVQCQKWQVCWRGFQYFRKNDERMHNWCSWEVAFASTNRGTCTRSVLPMNKTGIWVISWNLSGYLVILLLFN